MLTTSNKVLTQNVYMGRLNLISRWPLNLIGCCSVCKKKKNQDGHDNVLSLEGSRGRGIHVLNSLLLL